jgi:Bacterial Ig domain/Secretion system C-terminal sorting domain
MYLKRSLFYLNLLFLMLPANVAAQQRNWKKLRQEGANFYEIQDTFERQNATLLQAFRNAPPQHEGDEEGKFNSIIKYNRWANRLKTRVSESQGDLSAITMGNARALAQRATELQGRTGESWQLVSPPVTPTNGGNGRVNAVRIHPNNPNILFACTPAGGLWKSVDGGTSWAGASENIAILGCSDIGFSPTDPNTMYLATGDGEWSDSYSTGVYKSTDGGLNWLPTGFMLTIGQKEVLSRLLVHPNDGSILVTGSGGIRRSTDGGATWTLVSSLNTRDMEFKPDNPAIVYAAQYDPTGSCFLRSTNGGATWTTITTGLPTTGIIRAAIGVTPADANYVYLMVSDNWNYGLMGIYRSTDAGLTFTRVGPSSPSNTMGWSATGSDSGGQGLYDIAIAVSPTNRDLLFTGGVNIWKSSNGGATFTIAAHWRGELGTPYVHADIHDLVYNGTELWVGCDGGVFKTTNNGVSWADKSANLSIAQMYGFGQSMTNPNLIVSGHQDNGTNLMTSPSQWSQVFGGDGMKCFIDRTNDNTIFASVYYGNIFRSTNRGVTFTALPAIQTGDWVTPWLQDPISANILYAGGTDVYKSVNAGTSWTTVSNFGNTEPIAALDVARPNNQIIVAAKGSFAVGRRVYTPYVYKSSNGGTTWTNITGSNFPTNASIIGIHIDVNNANRIYVGFASYTGNSVYISNNGGTTWTNYAAGLPSIPANCFVTTSGNADGETFVGTDLGVYRRTNSMSAWEPFSHNLPSASVTEMQIYYPTSQLRISTFGRGIWQTALPGHNSLPVVRLTTPTTGQNFTSPANINLAATATDADGRIVRVEFYQGNTRLATDTSAPYTTTWSNVTVGNYELTAKAVDDSAYVSTSYPVSIRVLGLHDAQLSAILEPSNMVTDDTTWVRVRVKNEGANPLTALTIQYQLDNQALQSHSWVGSIASLADTTIRLATILRYAVGAHQLLVYTSNPNGMIDENQANDTLRHSFTYEVFGTCSDNYEPNNTATTTTLIPTNVTIRSKLTTRTDIDAFRFKTTLQQPAFKVVLNELPSNFDLAIFKHDYRTNQILFMGESFRTGLLTDSVVLDYLVDTGTYYAVVSVDVDTPSNQCYALRVETRETARYDLSVDSILTPRGEIFSNRFNASVRIRNRGNANITSFEVVQRLNANSSQWQSVSLPVPLLPDSTVIIQLNQITGYAVGYHALAIYSNYPNGHIDINRTNDTAFSTFRYLLRPTVVLNTPLEGQIFADNATISLTATATAPNAGASVSKVEFYNGATLLATDNTFPYAFTWSNVPIGSYSLSAKVYDNANYTGISAMTRIHVSGATDAGVSNLVNSDVFMGYDSVRPLVRVRNFGTDTLQQVTISYQLDNQPIVNQSFINSNLSTGARANFTLPIVRYAVGVHTFKVWTTQPNGLTDMNPQNDTLIYEFEYQGFGGCADNYEPNNTVMQATPIPTNVTVRSKLAMIGDRDYFMFKTTAQQPSFTVILNELSHDHDLIVYQWNYATQSATEIGWSFRSGLVTDSVSIDFAVDTGTYIASVLYGSGFNECYALRIRTHEPVVYDIGISNIQVPNGVIETATLIPTVQVRNLGNTAINSFYIESRIDNNWQMSSSFNLTTPLQPNDTINVSLPVQTGYAIGAHQFYAYTSNPNWRTDMNPTNDSMSVPFRYVAPPFIQLVVPTQGQVYNANSNINLWAIARPASNNSTIARVEFYSGATLIGIDSTVPYQFSWQNAPIGTYLVRAKAIDSDSIVAFTPIATIHVAGSQDAGVLNLENSAEFTYQDSAQPVIRIRNYGAQPLTSVRVHLQLDSQTVVTQSFSGNNLNGGFPVIQGSWTIVTLPILRYTLGSHTLTTWTSAPNDSVDLNRANDTFRQTFESRDFSLCGDFFEPNNGFANATSIPTDRIVRSKLAQSGDIDYFTFKTTSERPYFTAVLYELPQDYDLEIYRFDSPSNQYLYVGSSFRSGTQIDSVRYTARLDSGTYVAIIKWGSGNSECYALKINTIAIPATIRLLSPTSGAQYPYWSSIPLTAQMIGATTNPTKVSFFINGNLLYTDSIAPYTQVWTNVTDGVYSVVVKAYNAQNVVISESAPIYVVVLPNRPPVVNWVTPTYGQIFPLNSSIPLEVTASDIDSSGRITKVEFYKDAQLLATDSIAPYNYNWLNAPLGMSRLNARAYDNWGAVTMNSNMILFVKARLDANVLSINRPVDSIKADTAAFQISLRNLGLDTLRSVQINYQLNQNAIGSQVWTGVLTNNGVINVDLPTLRLTQFGLQALKVWTTLPNQGLDENRGNDTLMTTFRYLRTGVSTVLKNGFQFKIAPNPARDQFTIFLQTSSNQIVDYQLVVKDVLGRAMLQRNLTNRDVLTPISIETEGWSKGMYFVSIQREGQLVTEKLVIE